MGLHDLRLDKASWSLTGFSIKLVWDSTTDRDLIELSSGWGKVDFTSVGGIANNSGAGATGDVMFTSTGYEASGEGGSFVLSFKKTNKGVIDTTPTIEVGVGSIVSEGLLPVRVVA